VIHGGGVEDRVGGQVLHGHLDHAQDEQIGGGESHESIGNQSKEMCGASSEFIGSLAQFVQLALGIRAEVDVRDQEATDEEEGVHTEGPIGDGLEEEVLLHLLAHLQQPTRSLSIVQTQFPVLIAVNKLSSEYF